MINPGWGEVYGMFTVQPGGEIPEYIQDVVYAELYVDKYGGHATLR